jgi:NADPH:quinone reductase-like Zn-dependent oxidoreductase
MKTIVAKSGSEIQDAGAFILNEQPVTEPGTHDLLVRIIAIGMNHVDTKVCKLFDNDAVLGWDAYGLVEKIGADVTGFKAGDKVFYAGDVTRAGCSSQYHLVDHRIVGFAYFDNDSGQFASPHPDAREPQKSETMVRVIEAVLAETRLQKT